MSLYRCTPSQFFFSLQNLTEGSISLNRNYASVKDHKITLRNLLLYSLDAALVFVYSDKRIREASPSFHQDELL